MILAVLSAVALGASILGEPIKLRVIAQGFPPAAASYIHKLMPDGSKQSQLAIEIAVSDGKRTRVRVDRTYAASGVPVRIFSDTSSEKPKYRKTATATFDALGAHVVIDENGKRSVHQIPLAATAPRECLPEFWFLRDKPKPSAICKYYHFDIDKLEWRIVESEYLGLATIKLGGTSFRTHRIRTSSGEAYLDDSGNPVKIIDSALEMSRVVT